MDRQFVFFCAPRHEIGIKICSGPQSKHFTQHSSRELALSLSLQDENKIHFLSSAIYIILDIRYGKKPSALQKVNKLTSLLTFAKP